MRQLRRLGPLAVVLGCALAAHTAWASGGPLNLLRSLSHNFLMHSSQGYLGVDLQDVSPERASALKLKDSHGVEVVAVDHDAPAAKAGIRIHDIVLQMNGQPVQSCTQLRHMLRKQPPGRIVTFVVGRDGSPVNFTVQLADRLLLEHQASQHLSAPNPPEPPASPAGASESFISSKPGGESHFLDALIPNPLYVGADVSPVRTQLADYFGVTSGTGLLVENVDGQSSASQAGLRAGDVITRVGSTPMVSRGDWLKAIRGNRGKPIQVTIMRDKQEKTLTMLAGVPKQDR